MTIKKPESFWDILIYVTVLMTAFMGVGILLNYIYPEWGRLIWILFLLLLAILKEIPFLKKWADKHFPEMLSVVAAVTAGAQLVLKFLALKKMVLPQFS